MDILIICLRTIVSYFILILALRVMGKREIGQLNLFDLIILLSLADIMIIGIENYDEKWTHVIVPVVLLTIIQKIIAKVLLKSSKIRTLIDGKPSFIIIDGKLCIKEMKKQSYNMEDLLLQLRQKDVYNILNVKYAILETSGKLSIVLNENKVDFFPFPIIISGCIEQETLELLGIKEEEILEKLGNNRLEISEIKCAYYDENRIIVVEEYLG